MGGHFYILSSNLDNHEGSAPTHHSMAPHRCRGLCGLVDLCVPPALPHIHKLCVVAAVPLTHLFKAKAGTILHSGSVQLANLSLPCCNGLTTDGSVGGSGVHLYDPVVSWPAI